jgi:serine/threonine protein kinase
MFKAADKTDAASIYCRPCSMPLFYLAHVQILYAVKTIACPSDNTEELLVDIDETIIKWASSQMFSNIITVHDIWKDRQIGIAERLCVRMDWGGTSLQVFRNRGSTWDGLPWIHLMRGIVNGLSRAHYNHKPHGDLKPSNGLPN